MTRVIHKAVLTETETYITVSSGAFRILTVHERHGSPTVWYETLEKPIIPTKVKFTIVPTGGEVPGYSQYAGTTFCDPFVWHVYMSQV